MTDCCVLGGLYHALVVIESEDSGHCFGEVLCAYGNGSGINAWAGLGELYLARASVHTLVGQGFF
jgi:hypothetical protein